MPKRKPHQTGRSKKPISEPESNTIYFYKPNVEPYGVFCQWHTSPIDVPVTSLHFLTTASASDSSTTEQKSPPTAFSILSTYSSKISFFCAEQFYMFCKALYFSDAPSCARILSTPSPKEQKTFGQRVANFNDYKWSLVKSRVCRVGNWYKFTDLRNWRIKDVLMGTGEKELVEASRRDRV